MADASEWEFTPRQQALYKLLLKELELLRRHKPGPFYVNDMFDTPNLVRVLGAGNPSDAHSALVEIVNTKRYNSREVQAAHTTLFWSLGETIDERLEEAGRDLGGLTARNARPYSDRGLQIIARWIVIDLTFASARATPEYDVTVLHTEAGRVTLEVQASGPPNGQVGRPNWIEVNRKRQNYPDAELVVEDDHRVTMRWAISAKLPQPAKIKAGEVALEIVIALRVIALPNISFSDEFIHPDYKVRFTSRRNIAYVQVLRETVQEPQVEH